MSDHASDMLKSMCRFYKMPPALLLRVIVESVLDAASEDGAMQADLAAAVRYCRCTGHVPDCWLEVEGERYEEGPDDAGSGSYVGNEEVGDSEMRQSSTNYGDFAAQWGELDDSAVFKLFCIEGQRRRNTRFSSLVDAG